MLFMFGVYHAVMSVHFSLVVTCWERASILALLYVMFSYGFCHFPIWCPGSLSIPDFCLPPYFDIYTCPFTIIRTSVLSKKINLLTLCKRGNFNDSSVVCSLVSRLTYSKNLLGA